MKAGKPLSLKARAIALLAQREHSRAELRRKLLRIEKQMHMAQQRQMAMGPASPAGQAAGFEPRSTPASGGLDSLVRADAHDAGDGDLVEGPACGDPDFNHRAFDVAQAGTDVDSLLSFLEERGYLSEARFVDARIHARATRFGSQRIKLELAQHGLHLSSDQRAALKDTELARARHVWLRKFGGLPPQDAAARAKQARFLIARGFAADVVGRVLRGLGAEDD